MTEERARHIRRLDTLAPLSDHTDIVHVNEAGHVVISGKLEPPLDEFGIPRTNIMVDRLLGALSRQYMWTGTVDEHHMATPKADYTIVRTAHEGRIGSNFRGISQLKIDLPRMMHNAAHAFFEYYPRTSESTMRQALMEVAQMADLRRIINYYAQEDYCTSDVDTKVLCFDALRSKIDSLKPMEVNMMPSLDDLQVMTYEELAAATSRALRVRIFSERSMVHPLIRKASTHRYPVRPTTNVA